jgi:hypothetical protein
VNKDHQACLTLLVDEEHALAKAVRCGLDSGLGVLMLRSVLCELLIGGDKLAGVNISRALGVKMTLIAVPSLTIHPPRHLG